MSAEYAVEPQAPPSDFDAEQAVLGAMLLEGDAACSRAFAVLAPDDFYRTYHRSIALAIQTVYQRREPVDLVTISAELRRTRQLEEVGGGEYLSSLIGEVPTASHLPRYANIVAGCSVQRRIMAEAREIIGGAGSNPENIGAFLAASAERLQRIYRERVQGGVLHGPMDTFEADVTALWERLQSPRQPVSAARFGIGAVDQRTGGLEGEQLVVLKADTKHGKSQLSRQCALTTARRFRDDDSDRHVLCFILEEGEEAFKIKSLAWMAGLDSKPMLTAGWWPRYEQANPEAAQRLVTAQSEWATLPIRYTDRVKDLSQIEATCRALSYELPIGLVVIDYLQLIRGGDPALREGEQQLSERANRLQDLAAVELKCPVLCPAQITYDPANKRTYTKGARGIEFNASLVLEWRRQIDEAGEMQDTGRLACLLARNGAGFAPVSIITDSKSGRFWDVEEHAALVAAQNAVEWPNG
jgi:replicative DNA helicase